ncbi:MAG: class I SAM-dependent methyltransferase [Candidatus Eremiobacteraeota bacterium]|nr:class I SAM-dependent methyltransferase [Candidatus Eremiobacteraeota bacterium]
MTRADEDDPNSSYALMLDMIEGPATVLDLGCGPGNFARQLVSRGCAVVGLDLNPEHLESARAYCRETHVVDLEREALDDVLRDERFDVAICADILEHLRDPRRVLEGLRTVLAPGGCVLASIPNVAHGAVRLALLAGRFEYQPFGILDDTHVHFYTNNSITALFEDAGYVIVSTARTLTPIFDSEAFLVPKIAREDFPPETIERVESAPESETLQFVIKAIPRFPAPPRREAIREVPHVAMVDANLDLLARLHTATRGAEAAEAQLAEHSKLLARLRERWR